MSGKVWFRIILILSLRADVVPMAQQEPQSEGRGGEGRGGEEVRHPLRAVSMQRRPVSCSPLTLRNVLVPVDRGEVQSSHGPRVVRSRQGTRGGTDVRRKGLHWDLRHRRCSEEGGLSHVSAALGQSSGV